MSTNIEPILQLTPHARDKVLRVIAQDELPETLALWVEIVGVEGMTFKHKLRVAPVADAEAEHVVQHHDDLPLVLRSDQVDELRGATVTVEGDPVYGAVVVANPNRPTSPVIGVTAGDLSGDLAQRVAQLLDAVVNPSIAAHGGRAELVAVEDDVAYLRLSGGCQGCGMAKVTLTQGIEVAIRENLPEISKVVDVTDHEAGTSPYFESAKK